MKHSMFIITSMFIFLGCSQESSEKKSATVIKVEKEVPKKVDKDSALICIDSDKKITCKLLTKRVNKERDVEFYWQSPMGKDDRERKMVLPANHASIFDARNKLGRAKGVWSVELQIDGEEISTSFAIN